MSPKPTLPPGVVHLNIPIEVLRELEAEPRLLVKDRFLIGIPVPPEVLKRPELLKELKGYQLVLVPQEVLQM